MQRRRSSVAGAVLALVFSIPFLAGGVACLVGAYRRFGMNPRPQDTAVMLAFGIILSVFAALLIGAGVIEMKRQRQLREWQVAYPGAPWMWRREWQKGRIVDRSSNGVVFIWLFAIVWLSGAAMMVREVSGTSTKGLLVLAGFAVLIGLAIVYWGVVVLLRRRRFGRSTLVMSTFPAPVGGRFNGQIETSVPRETFAGAKLDARLSCVERIVRRGKNKGTIENVQWNTEAKIPMASVSAGPAGAVLPVSFSIPSNLESSSFEDGSRTIVWRLHVTGKMAGADYEGVFELPVFDRSEAITLSESATA